MFIAGSWAEAADGRSFTVINPATGQALADVPWASAVEVDQVAKAARFAFDSWRSLGLCDRIDRVLELANRIRAEAEHLAVLDMEDLGSPVRAMKEDVISAADRINYFCSLVPHLKGECFNSTKSRLHYTLHQPIGPSALLLAFNHPFKFAAVKSIPVLLMGNPVVLKPSQLTPRSSLHLASLASDLFPAGVFNVITGDGAETGATLCAHPSIRKITLIGGVETGRQVLTAAAQTIKSVNLELGGKNPIIIYPDADLDAATDAIVKGMNFSRSQGQSCGSTSRLFLHDDVREIVLPRLIDRMRAIRPASPALDSTVMGSLVSVAHRDRVLQAIEAAVAAGAIVLTGGRPPSGDAFAQGAFLEPTLLDGVHHKMPIAHEEVFGPVLCIFRWSDEATMISHVNDVIYGLTASVWTRDLATAHRIASTIEAGVVWINEVGRHTPGVPFGGWKQSGLGRADSMEELLSYSQNKSISLSF